MDNALNIMRDEAYRKGLEDGAKDEKEIARKWWAIGQGDIGENFEAIWERENAKKVHQNRSNT